MLKSFFIRNALFVSSIGIGFSLPIAPITSQAAPTIKGLVSSSNNTVIKIIYNTLK